MDQRQASVAQGHPPSTSSHSSLSSDVVPSPAPHPEYPLYDPTFEHDACGMGFVANTSGVREHRIVSYALEGLANLAAPWRNGRGRRNQ